MHAAADVDAVGGVDRGRGPAHLGAEAADERRRQPLEHGHRAAAGAGRRGDLEADEPGADDHDPRRAVGDPLAQGERVVERAQLVDGRDGLLARAGACVAEPVAMITPSPYGTVEPSASSTARASMSSPTAGTPRRRSSPIVAYSLRAGAGRCGRAPTRRRAASSTAAGGRRAGAARRRSA